MGKTTIEVKYLGLAAYMKMKGCKLLDIRSKIFIFECEKSYQEWEIEYANSCCRMHDENVMYLRNLISG
jgi:hypothetical protein